MADSAQQQQQQQQQQAGPPGFQWIEESLGLEAEAATRAGAGCSCSGGGCSLQAGCECCRRNPLGPLYDAEGRLIVLVHRTEMDDTIFECGPACACAGAGCPNAITQQGGRARTRLAQLGPGKGWGVLAEEPIPAGAGWACGRPAALASSALIS